MWSVGVTEVKASFEKLESLGVLCILAIIHCGKNHVEGKTISLFHSVFAVLSIMAQCMHKMIASHFYFCLI